MKKYVLIAGAGLLLTAGVTATVLSNSGKKKTPADTSKKCTYSEKCKKAYKTACY